MVAQENRKFYYQAIKACGIDDIKKGNTHTNIWTTLLGRYGLIIPEPCTKVSHEGVQYSSNVLVLSDTQLENYIRIYCSGHSISVLKYI